MCKKKLERWQSIKVYDNMLCVKSKVYEISFKVNRISMRLIIMKNNHSSQLNAGCCENSMKIVLIRTICLRNVFIQFSA